MSAVLEKPLATTGTTPKELEREPLVLNQR